MSDRIDNDKNLDDLLGHFVSEYLPRREVAYRLPLSMPIREFWPKLITYRKSKRIVLPLLSAKGEPYWYVPTEKLLAAGDKVAEMARSDAAFMLPQYQDLLAEGLLDEAYFSSLIEGAVTTRQEAHAFLKSGAVPKDQTERMILNNYRALEYVLGKLDEPITEEIILEISRILTEGTLEVGAKHGYRDAGVQVVSGRQEIVYIAPDAQYVKPMMDQLIAFIASDDVHPVLKACITHAYFVTIHPLFDGNGRTARALSYMILLQEGYDFFRQFPISGVIAQERPKYYKAIRNVQSPENENDMTYFIEYHTEMLARSVDALNEQVAAWGKLKAVTERLKGLGNAPERLVEGAQWLLTSNAQTITAEVWSKKWQVSFETARQDLTRLDNERIVRLEVHGRKHIYVIVRDTDPKSSMGEP